MKNTTAASKFIPRRPRISINWNPPFGPFLWSKFSKINFFNNFRIAPKIFFALQYIKNWTKVVPWKIFFLFLKKIVSLKKTLKRNLLVVPFQPVVVIGLGKNLLFKSVLAHCVQWMTGRFRFLVLKITFAKVCMYCVLKEGNGHFGRLLRLFSQ